MIRHFLIALCLIAGLAPSAPAQPAEYLIDSVKAHAAANFCIKHLGFNWQTGRFDNLSGSFSFDEANPRASSIFVKIDTASVNTNHARRNNHIRSADFLDLEFSPAATGRGL